MSKLVPVHVFAWDCRVPRENMRESLHTEPSEKLRKRRRFSYEHMNSKLTPRNSKYLEFS